MSKSGIHGDMAVQGEQAVLSEDSTGEEQAVQANANTSVGQNNIPAEATGSGNTAVGDYALSNLSTGNNNTGVGMQALAAITTTGDNVAVGAGAERANTGGSRNTVVGASAGLIRTAGNDNVSVGFGAQGAVINGGSGNVAIGREALPIYEGDDATAIGTNALQQATGSRNTAVGSVAGTLITTGGSNVFLGYAAGSNTNQKPDASNSLVLGYSAYSDANNQIALGNDDHVEVKMFGTTMFRKAGVNSLFIGNAGNLTATQGANVVIGHTAGFSLDNADSNTLIGYEAGYYLTSGGNNVAVGARALLSGTTARDCTAVGAGALNKMVDGVGTTAVGRYSLESLVQGGNNTAIGDSSARNLYGGADANAAGQGQGEQNCIMGYGTMRYGYYNSYSVVIGQGALYNAGKPVGPLPEDGGTPTDPGTPSNYNAIVGWLAFENTSGGGHTGLGANAGRSLTGGNDTIFIGRDAGFGAGQKVDASGSVVIGVGAISTRDNEIVIGKDDDTHVTLAGVTFTKTQLAALLALVS